MHVPSEPSRNGQRRDDGRPSASPLSPDKKRLRDDVKPMFQRDIGYATPSKDGTAKKGFKDGKGKYSPEDAKRRSVKTIG